MEYTIRELAELAGVSTRTLRYYDGIGLLAPSRLTEGGYRVYGPAQVNRLQQILFYRELGFDLAAIRAAVDARDFDRGAALADQRQALVEQRARLDRLIRTIDRTIQEEKGERIMTDQEKFEGFKRELVEENERKYGGEIREKYGDKTVEESNARMMGLTRERYDAMQALGKQMQEALERAVTQGADPAGAAGQEIAALHKKWLGFTWGDGHYSPEAHRGLAQMYVDDARFTAYYDGSVPGCAQFLRDAVAAYTA